MLSTTLIINIQTTQRKGLCEMAAALEPIATEQIKNSCHSGALFIKIAITATEAMHEPAVMVAPIIPK